MMMIFYVPHTHKIDFNWVKLSENAAARQGQKTIDLLSYVCKWKRDIKYTT